MNLSGFEARISEALGTANRQQIADILGVKYQTVSNWLNGRAEFPIKSLAEIANKSDYSLNWILTGKGEKRTARPEPPSIIDMRNLTAMMREIVREEISNLRSETPKPEVKTESEEDVKMEPIEMMLAPVVAHIGPGVRKIDPKDEIRKSLVTDEAIIEMEERLKTRKRKSG